MILSDGDVVFQPRKVERRHSAERYVLVDDKLRTLTAVTNVRGERATTVLPRQGKFANDPHVLASYPEADVTIDRTSDPLAFELPVLAAGHRRSPLLQR